MDPFVIARCQELEVKGCSKRVELSIGDIARE